MNKLINIGIRARFVKIIVVLVLTIIFMQSCIMDKKEESSQSVTVEANISLNNTKAFTDGNVLSEVEYKIKKVRVMIFSGNGRTLEKTIIYDTLTSFNILQGGIFRIAIPINISDSGNNISVIVNEPDTLVASLNKITTVSALNALKYEIEHFMKTPAYRIKDGTFESNPDFYIPFYGERFVSRATHYIGEGRIAPILIKVERVVARVDIYVRKSDVLKADATIGNYTSLDIKQTAKESFLTPATDNITPILKDTLGVLTGPSPEIKVPIKDNFSKGTHIFSFYVPEFYISNVDFGFTLKNVKISDGRSKNYPILIGKTKQSVHITRNTVYKMICNLDDSEHPLEIYYSKWGEEERRIVFN